MSQPARALPVDRPTFRQLRAYAFDPSLSIQLENADINTITMKVPWDYNATTGEDALMPGPVGEYLEVVDVDPASGCYYAPVDLNHPRLLAQDGLAPSERIPQFHQQMVYAVAMTTIRNFEIALGRTAFWAPHRTLSTGGQGRQQYSDQYVKRLRIYPHALREANAYYSPAKQALLFGYFPASASDPRNHLPGGIVFTCLSHDIIAHETTHALLDGLHPRFNEASNPDVLAFHEAFADIVALFQHFSLPDVLRHQIARTRGDLSAENLLGQLAQEFGQATGSHGSLRDALGGFNAQSGRWEPHQPDPKLIQSLDEPHDRGALLVAAVFDLFVSIYKARIADLLRIATGGTGVLPAGDLHPDLVKRLAGEAAKSAQHVLTMCIRALDYCPPFDLTFGEYLRALVTADYDLVRDDDMGYRVAAVGAFLRRGIYPREVRSMSIDSLRWSAPAGADLQLQSLPRVVTTLRSMAAQWNLARRDEQLYSYLQSKRRELHLALRSSLKNAAPQASLGLDLARKDAKFEIHSLRPARRLGPDGQSFIDLVIEITQWKSGYFDPQIQAQVDGGQLSPPPHDFVFRGGCTLLVDPESWQIRYSIRKNINSADRIARQRAFLSGDSSAALRPLYFGQWSRQEPFALLHRSVD